MVESSSYIFADADGTFRPVIGALTIADRELARQGLVRIFKGPFYLLAYSDGRSRQVAGELADSDRELARQGAIRIFYLSPKNGFQEFKDDDYVNIEVEPDFRFHMATVHGGNV